MPEPTDPNVRIVRREHPRGNASSAPIPPPEPQAATRIRRRTVEVLEVRCVQCGVWFPRFRGRAVTCSYSCRQRVAAARRYGDMSPPYAIRELPPSDSRG